MPPAIRPPDDDVAASGVLVVGESLVDVVLEPGGAGVREHPGGSPANVALALGRLGRHVELVTRLGEDARGASVREWLSAAGVRVVTGEPAPTTSIASAVLDEHGSASYSFDLDWDVDAGALAEAAPGAAHLHVGSIGAFLEPGAAHVRAEVAARRPHATVSYDPNVRPELIADRRVVAGRILELALLADVVKASDEDLAWINPGTDPIATARAWREAGVPVVVVTRGAAGLCALTPSGEVSIAAPAVPVADTVGAGDTVTAALIDGLAARGLVGAAGRARWAALRAGDWARMLADAAAAAAITVSRPGADPPTRAELDARLGR